MCDGLSSSRKSKILNFFGERETPNSKRLDYLMMMMMMMMIMMMMMMIDSYDAMGLSLKVREESTRSLKCFNDK